MDGSGEEPAGATAVAAVDNAERSMIHFGPTLRAYAGQTMAGRCSPKRVAAIALPVVIESKPTKLTVTGSAFHSGATYSE